MALTAKREGIKQVPWFSLTEWHQVYKQIYSNDTTEQTMAYETLLAWKARMPKLPVGVDCTLSIMQVCLRDREWTPKIDTGELSISYENDLCLIYSTTIMRFLNHISNIGHTKQTSLFQIAKQLNIPEWIVNLRHDAAHGHELPSIGVLRRAINILLTWLHEEYWVAEAKTMGEYYTTDTTVREAQEAEEVQAFRDLIELWTAVSLYIYAGYHLVSSIPDTEMQDTLQDLRSFAIDLLDQRNGEMEDDKDDEIQVSNDDIKKNKKYTLITAQTVLLSEISRYLRKKSIPNKESIVFDALFNIEVFLPRTDALPIFAEKQTNGSSSLNVLPLEMVKFWQSIIFLLQEKGMLEILIFKLLDVTNNRNENKQKRLFASLWIKSICYSYAKLDAAQRIARTLEYKFERSKKTFSIEDSEERIKRETDRTYPHLRSVLWVDISRTVPSCFADTNFVTNLVLNVNEFSIKFIPSVLELATTRIDEQKKQTLLNLANIYIGNSVGNHDSSSNKLYTIEDYGHQPDQEVPVNNNNNTSEKIIPYVLADEKLRNPNWKLALEDCDWAGCTIGVLPWQTDSLEMLRPYKATLIKCDASRLDSEIIPGVINVKDLNMESKINWEDVLRKKRRMKRKHEKRNSDAITKRALETIKRQK